MWRRTLTGCTGCCGAVASDQTDENDTNSPMLQDEQETRELDEAHESRINDDQFMQTSISDVPLWKKSPKESCLERSDVIDGIIRNRRADCFGEVLEHGWDVNEMLQVYRSGRGRVQRTALHHAVFCRWHEGVRVLLTAGANCNIKCEWSGEADLSVPHHLARDQNRHFAPDNPKHTPLCVAIYKDDVESVKLLLQNGADLKDSGCEYLKVNMERLKMQRWIVGCTEITQKENSEVLNELLTNGTRVRKNLVEQLQIMLLEYLMGRQFFSEHLTVLFTHGVHIDTDYVGSTLSHAFVSESPINAIRWLIRHGASGTRSLFPMLCLASIIYRMLEGNDYLVGAITFYKLPLLEVLLEVGIKPTNSLKVHLSELEMTIQAYLQQGDSGDHEAIIYKTAHIYRNIIEAEDSRVSIDQKRVFPVEREQQLAHLREFSDHSLDVYPEELNTNDSRQERWEHTLKLCSNMLSFLNQPQTLQWYSRVCLRESLVSLSPSVIRKLPVPASLKRYILCHEL